MSEYSFGQKDYEELDRFGHALDTIVSNRQQYDIANMNAKIAQVKKEKLDTQERSTHETIRSLFDTIAQTNTESKPSGAGAKVTTGGLGANIIQPGEGADASSASPLGTVNNRSLAMVKAAFELVDGGGEYGEKMVKVLGLDKVLAETFKPTKPGVLKTEDIVENGQTVGMKKYFGTTDDEGNANISDVNVVPYPAVKEDPFHALARDFKEKNPSDTRSVDEIAVSRKEAYEKSLIDERGKTKGGSTGDAQLKTLKTDKETKRDMFVSTYKKVDVDKFIKEGPTDDNIQSLVDKMSGNLRYDAKVKKAKQDILDLQKSHRKYFERASVVGSKDKDPFEGQYGEAKTDSAATAVDATTLAWPK